ncbi:MAG: hypothetical protein EA001_03645 [Oscillatoriales cyanobacterium]|nr:MAG: hypothetical protein EA001_03645 [Oscillatoriales cyanobacterium]
MEQRFPSLSFKTEVPVLALSQNVARSAISPSLPDQNLTGWRTRHGGTLLPMDSPQSVERANHTIREAGIALLVLILNPAMPFLIGIGGMQCSLLNGLTARSDDRTGGLDGAVADPYGSKLVPILH